MRRINRIQKVAPKLRKSPLLGSIDPVMTGAAMVGRTVDAAPLQGRGRRACQQDGADHLGAAGQGRGLPETWCQSGQRSKRLWPRRQRELTGPKAGKRRGAETDVEPTGQNPDAREAAVSSVLRARSDDQPLASRTSSRPVAMRRAQRPDI